MPETVRVELHCHSRHSDGSDSVAEVCAKAQTARLALFALTDHDTWGGSEAAADLAPAPVVLRAMELSCVQRGRTVHLLLYGIASDGPGHDALAGKLTEVRTHRQERIALICERFLRWNIRLDAARILADAGQGTPGRPHVARALVTAGVCSSVREAFDRFLKDGGPADVPTQRLEISEALSLARAAGARVSLAHPHLLGSPFVVREAVTRLRPEGLEGLEAAYGAYAPRVRAEWTALADDVGLVVTGGSDYHGLSVVPDVTKLGIDMDSERARRLAAWLGVEISLPS